MIPRIRIHFLQRQIKLYYLISQRGSFHQFYKRKTQSQMAEPFPTTERKSLESRSLTLPQLRQVINEWYSSYTRHIQDPTSSQKTPLEFQNSPSVSVDNNFLKGSTFKYPLAKILPLPSQLPSCLIAYFCMEALPFALSDVCSDNKVGLSMDIKKIYQKEFLKGKWADEFAFQFACYFITKMISDFVAEYFPSIRQNQNLNSVILIIILKVFIGTEVGIKAYKALERKFLKKSNSLRGGNIKINCPLIPSKNQDLPQLSLPKPSAKVFSSVGSSLCSSTKKNAKKHKLKRNHTKYKVSLVHMDPKNENITFADEVKRSLHVEPLPEIKVEKRDIEDFVDSKQFTDSQKTENIPNGKDEELNTFLMSRTLSSSVEMLFKECCNSKADSKIKISRPFQGETVNLLKRAVDQKDKTQERVWDKSKREGSDCKLLSKADKTFHKIESKKWEKIIKGIKSQSKGSSLYNKQNLTLNYRSQYKLLNQTSDASEESKAEDQKLANLQKSRIFQNKSSKVIIEALNLQKKESSRVRHRTKESVMGPIQGENQRLERLRSRSSEKSRIEKPKSFLSSITQTESEYKRARLDQRIDSDEIGRRVRDPVTKKLSKVCMLRANRAKFYSKCQEREQIFSYSQFQIQKFQ